MARVSRRSVLHARVAYKKITIAVNYNSVVIAEARCLVLRQRIFVDLVILVAPFVKPPEHL